LSKFVLPEFRQKIQIRVQLLHIGADNSPNRLINPDYFLSGKYKLILIFVYINSPAKMTDSFWFVLQIIMGNDWSMPLLTLCKIPQKKSCRN